jgi:hypothetical protein
VLIGQAEAMPERDFCLNSAFNGGGPIRDHKQDSIEL